MVGRARRCPTACPPRWCTRRTSASTSASTAMRCASTARALPTTTGSASCGPGAPRRHDRPRHREGHQRRRAGAAYQKLAQEPRGLGWDCAAVGSKWSATGDRRRAYAPGRRQPPPTRGVAVALAVRGCTVVAQLRRVVQGGDELACLSGSRARSPRLGRPVSRCRSAAQRSEQHRSARGGQRGSQHQPGDQPRALAGEQPTGQAQHGAQASGGNSACHRQRVRC